MGPCIVGVKLKIGFTMTCTSRLVLIPSTIGGILMPLQGRMGAWVHRCMGRMGPWVRVSRGGYFPPITKGPCMGPLHGALAAGQCIPRLCIEEQTVHCMVYCTAPS